MTVPNDCPVCGKPYLRRTFGPDHWHSPGRVDMTNFLYHLVHDHAHLVSRAGFTFRCCCGFEGYHDEVGEHIITIPDLVHHFAEARLQA